MYELNPLNCHQKEAVLPETVLPPWESPHLTPLPPNHTAEQINSKINSLLSSTSAHFYSTSCHRHQHVSHFNGTSLSCIVFASGKYLTFFFLPV